MEVRAARGGHSQDQVGRRVASVEESCEQQRRRGIEAGRCQRDDHLDGRPSALSRYGSGSEQEASWDGTGAPVAGRVSERDQGAQTDGWEGTRKRWKRREGGCRYLCVGKKRRGRCPGALPDRGDAKPGGANTGKVIT